MPWNVSRDPLPEGWVRLYNRDNTPAVLEWGSGTIAPGRSIDVSEDLAASFAPDEPGSRWMTDSQPPYPLPDPPADNPAGEGTEGLSVAGNGLSEPSLTVRPDGEIVNEAGEIVGHTNPEQEGH